MIVDETAEALAEAALRGYDDFVAGAPTAMAILRLMIFDDPSSLRIVSGNPAAAVLLRTTVEDATGKRLCDLVPNIPIFSERLANVSVLNTSLEAPSIKILNSESVYSLRAIPLPDQSIGLTIDDVTKAARTAESASNIRPFTTTSRVCPIASISTRDSIGRSRPAAATRTPAMWPCS